MSTIWGDTVADKVGKNGVLVVGIDPVLSDIPICFRKPGLDVIDCLDQYIRFVIEAATGLVGFVKLQSAFYEAFGSRGVGSLAKGIALARKSGLSIILDAKRGDIGTTAAAYAQAYLTPTSLTGSDLEVDCMTINPFLGPETLEPFIECARKYGKGLFILAKTSNPGAGWLQDQAISGTLVSDRIANLISTWASTTRGESGLSSIGAVVGATFPKDGERLRKLMPDSIFLVPGIGPQGGNPSDVRSLWRSSNYGVLVPVSRGVTKVDDISIGIDEYGQLIRDRINGLKEPLI